MFSLQQISVEYYQYHCLNNFIKLLSISLALARACAPTTGSEPDWEGLTTFSSLEGLSHLLLRFLWDSINEGWATVIKLDISWAVSMCHCT